MTMTFQNLNPPSAKWETLEKNLYGLFRKPGLYLMDNAHSELISTHISGAEVFGSCLSDYLLGKLGCDLHDAR